MTYQTITPLYTRTNFSPSNKGKGKRRQSEKILVCRDGFLEQRYLTDGEKRSIISNVKEAVFISSVAQASAGMSPAQFAVSLQTSLLRKAMDTGKEMALNLLDSMPEVPAAFPGDPGFIFDTMD